MKFGNYEVIKSKIRKKISEIEKFYNINMDELSFYEKRKYIFEYLCTTLSYDSSLLEKIKFNNMRTGIHRHPRNPYFEFESVMDNNIGVCNAISQYYKLLLEEVFIFSFCVNCKIFYNGELLAHQLNLVYDSVNQTFSFDDITCEILKKKQGFSFSYFNFDLDEANKKNERYGIVFISGISIWQILTEDYINVIIGRKKNEVKILYLDGLDEEKIYISNNNDFEKYGIVILKQSDKRKVI